VPNKRNTFNRCRPGAKHALSEPPDDMAPLFTAVQLVRLRDRMRGSTRLDYSAWLEPMEGQELEVRQLTAKAVADGKRSGARLKKNERESVAWRLAFFERDFVQWRDLSANETNAIAKFLSLLAGLQLNVTSELDELKSLSKRNDYALQRMEDFTKKLKTLGAGERAERLDDDSSIYHELLGIADSLEKLKGRVDEKAEDAIRLISLMTPSLDSQTLVDLLTGEV